jgi:hypothetical protein
VRIFRRPSRELETGELQVSEYPRADLAARLNGQL